jgi:hypothetical protein
MLGHSVSCDVGSSVGSFVRRFFFVGARVGQDVGLGFRVGGVMTTGIMVDGSGTDWLSHICTRRWLEVTVLTNHILYPLFIIGYSSKDTGIIDNGTTFVTSK